jgi:hypothetical protein
LVLLVAQVVVMDIQTQQQYQAAQRTKDMVVEQLQLLQLPLLEIFMEAVVVLVR